jgi:flap endonuclease-1
MGIDGLNPSLKKEAPSSQSTIRLDKFAGKSIAVDATCLAYRLMSRSNKTNISAFNVRLNPSLTNDTFQRDSDWYRHFIELAKTFTSFGIVPIFVFDGKSVPDKEATKEERKEEKRKMINRKKELEEYLENIPISQRSDKDIAELVSLKKNIVFVTSELTNNIKKILKTLGLPVVSAKGEAEKTCVSMAIDGHVAGVYSPDTDCIAMGCPITLTGIIGGNGLANLAFSAVIYDKILKEMHLTPSEFLDLCILSGSDFSKNIRGFRMKSIIKLYQRIPPDVPKTIENILPLMGSKVTDESLELLNYEKCRSTDIFGYLPTMETLDSEFHQTFPDLNINTKSVYEHGVEDILDSFGVGELFPVIRAALRNINSKINYKGGAERVLNEGRLLSVSGNRRIMVVENIPSPIRDTSPTSGSDKSNSGSDSDSPSRLPSTPDGRYAPPHQRLKIPENTVKPSLDDILREPKQKPKRPAKTTVFK